MEDKKQCRLCLQESVLQKSHIIPKFAIKYLKETSIGIRQTDNPNQRVQDGAKTYLLCSHCEQRFSSSEKYFSEKIFIPFLKEKKSSYTYDDNLFYFMTSVSWRILYYQLLISEKYYKDLNKDQLQFYIDTEKSMRDFLVGNTNDVASIQHHICFFHSYDELDWYNKKLIIDKTPNITIRRTVGHRLFESAYDEVRGSSANLCGIILYTFYKNNTGTAALKNTEIFNGINTIDISAQIINDVMGYELLNYTQKRFSSINHISSTQMKKLKSTMEDKKNQDKLQFFYKEIEKDEKLKSESEKERVVIKID